jgi:hypothetical protein
MEDKIEPSPYGKPMMADEKELERDLEMSNTMPLMEAVAGQLQDGGQRPRGSRAKKLIDLSCILLNIASTVLLVFINKW